MDAYHAVNDILVKLFNDIIHIEESSVITGEFKNITNNDMHVIEAIGIAEPKSMSMITKALSVTVGTFTIAVNNLVKKGYVIRNRSEFDRRVVLVSLSEKGKRAYDHHRQFHEEMIEAILENLDEEEKQVLVKALNRLGDFFRSRK